LTGRVHFAGFQTDPTNWLNAMDCYVLLSLFEGLPVALLEAMAGGLPIVATDVPGTRDVIKDRQNGLLVPLNDPAAAASQISRLIQSETLRHEMGSAARRDFLAHYQIADSAQAFKELYTTMIDEHRAGRRYVP
jgi:glycosyltransferase involved in cell wall biosynthesis